MNSYFYLQADKETRNAAFIEELISYSDENKKLIYVLNKPLTDQKYDYSFKEGLIILSPGNKIIVINFSKHTVEFEDYLEDILEDIGSISDKFDYKALIGRPRKWRDDLLLIFTTFDAVPNVEQLFKETTLIDLLDIKKIDLLISLFIGSINDVDRVKQEIPQTLLDKVKQKIQLFDGDQTRFVYQSPVKKRITIQGLSGTGKTELLLHKLKDLYTLDSKAKIYFTCHNKILADSLRKRIPSFFNFMRVEQQIEWNKRLWCTNAWGSRDAVNSGVYRYICDFYGIPFSTYSFYNSFSKVCQLAFDEIKSRFDEADIPYAFTYMIIDESQDFDENFYKLCELVTEKNVYIAGDIFQSIFDESISKLIEPDFLLGKCYRTDPKTLMFAHGLGMGLFEKNKLRWLEPQEWRDCGYNLDIKLNKYYLSREPLRRFEDLNDDFQSIKIVRIETSYSDTVIQIIRDLIEENSTIQPEDIGIIMLDTGNDIYKFADILEFKINSSIGWKVNKAYESKSKVDKTVFISNRNNVKGLEFPFVICVSKTIQNGYSYRNSIYTMLTRSFLRSYFVLPDSENAGLTEGMERSLQQIISDKVMVIDEPSDSEKEKIRTKFEYKAKRMSHYDTMMQLFRDLDIERKHHEKMFKITQQFEMLDSDYETLKDFVKDNSKYLTAK